MNIVLYSGGQQKSNHILHKAVVKLAREKNKNGTLQLTYIPFCSDNSSVFYDRAIRRYRSHGVERFFCLPVDQGLTRDEIKVTLSSDIIYLAGGNTFYFLHHLRKSGMLNHLRTFAKRGGVLAGLSAGGLIMSPTSKLAADPGLGPDENDVKLKDFSGLNFFPFEFSPHFLETPKQNEAHLAYSKKTPHPIFASSDGGGMVIRGHQYTVVGKGCFFYRGIKLETFKKHNA
jgi:dipeptidase E